MYVSLLLGLLHYSHLSICESISVILSLRLLSEWLTQLTIDSFRIFQKVTSFLPEKLLLQLSVSIRFFYLLVTELGVYDMFLIEFYLVFGFTFRY